MSFQFVIFSADSDRNPKIFKEKTMKITVLALVSVILAICIVGIAGCGGSSPTTSGQTSVQNASGISQLADTSTGSGLLRNESWLVGTWGATIPNTTSSAFAGNKINLNITSVMLVSNESVQGRPTGKFSYTGNLVWDVGGEERILVFTKEDWKTGDGSLMWEYASPGANQFMENITMRIYDLTFAFELDWGPQISKPGSTYKSLGFYGSIQNLDTSAKDNFDPSNLINFNQTSTTVPITALTKPATSSAVSSSTNTSTTTSTPSTTKTTSTGDIWSDIPVYPNAKAAEDEGFGLSGGGDESYSRNEWHFFASTDDFTKVVDFYKNQMPVNGWTKMMWVDSEEMSYGSFEKNNETRMCSIFIVKSEGGAAMNIQSLAQ
jgi:hypothetical protein